MITSVKGENIKGLTFEQPLGRLTLILGPNGAGKSVRKDALLLALMGYIPGSAKKTNPEIFAAYSSSPEKMIVGITLDNGFRLDRGFLKKGNSITQGYQVNGARSAKEFYYETIGKSGGVKAVDVGAFMDLSDQKKIDMLLELYPPKEDLKGIIDAADKGKVKILEFEQKARAKEDAAAELIASKAALNLPPGTLAEITGEIIRAEAQLEIAQENLTKAREAESGAKAKEEAEAKAKTDADAVKKKIEDAAKKSAEEIRTKAGAGVKAVAKAAELPLQPAEKVEPGPTSEGENRETSPIRAVAERLADKVALLTDVEASLKSILQAFKDADCGSCMARLVVLREMKKFKKEG
jgi:energy-coupling factor transporter ATP-binding protein EcfA2